MQIRRAFDRIHLGIAAVIAGGLWTLASIQSNDVIEGAIILGGPFAGAILRDWQSCCTEVSLQLAAIGGPVLALGVLAQFLINRSKGKNVLRYGLWAVSLVIWFGLSFFSIIHAVS
jgi:hypothetical protein